MAKLVFMALFKDVGNFGTEEFYVVFTGVLQFEGLFQLDLFAYGIKVIFVL